MRYPDYWVGHWTFAERYVTVRHGEGSALLFAYDLPHAIARLRQGDDDAWSLVAVAVSVGNEQHKRDKDARFDFQDDPLDRLSLARWQLSLGLAAEPVLVVAGLLVLLALALLTLGHGLLAALGGFGGAVMAYCRNVGLQDGDILGRLAQYAILAFVVLIALFGLIVVMPVIGLIFGQPNFDTIGTFACDPGLDPTTGVVTGASTL